MGAEVQYIHTIFGKQFQETRLIHTAGQRYMPGFKNLLVKSLTLFMLVLRSQTAFFLLSGRMEKNSLVQ